MKKVNEEKAKENLMKHIFADLSYEEIQEFEKYANLINSNIKLVGHVTAKDKPKFKTTKYIDLADKHNLQILITDFQDIESAKKGWKNIYIFKHEIMRQIILDAEKLDKNSAIYHFVQGKMYSYSDRDVVNFIVNFS